MLVYLALLDDFLGACMGQEVGNVNYSLNSDALVQNDFCNVMSGEWPSGNTGKVIYQCRK